VQTLKGQGAYPEEVRSELIGRRWVERAEIFKLNGDLEEQRPASDAYYVHDLRSATLALHGLRATFGGSFDPINEKFTELDRAFRVLEAGHGLAEAVTALDFLAAAERWEITSTRSRSSNPRDWEWLEARIRAWPEELGKLQPPESQRKVLDEVRKITSEAQRMPAWQTVNQEMKERFNPEASAGSRAAGSGATRR
jgi:hypothetical protein